jgi:hypothetical protein
MVDSIKITALQDIGANIAYTTLVPVVNMAGTPTTQKSNLQNLGNLILNGAGGSYFPRAAQATLALSVANAAQPNITSVGTLTSLSVTGNITAGNISGGNIVVANFYYGDGGFLTNVVANGSYSNSNVAAYLPTYTGNVGASNVNVTGTVYANGISSTGLASLTTLTVSTTANLGAVGNVIITGGSAGQKLTTNGNGVLSWTNDANSSYGNTNVANYLPTFTGTVGANKISSNGLSGSNVEINANGASFIFGEGGALYWPAGANLRVIETNIDGEFEIKSTTNVVISTDISNSNSHFTFDSEGIFTSPGNVNLLGSRLNVGPDAADVADLASPTLIIANSAAEFIQAAIININSNGSADWVAQGADSDDAQGFSDLGFTGHSFNDPNFTITEPGDGYVFSQGYANGIGGSLVLATGENGNTTDIVFATGGFLANNEFARIDHANDVFHLTRANSGIQFYDGTIQTTAGSGANTGNVTFDDVTVQGDNQLNLSPGPDYTANLAYLQVRAGDVPSHIHFDTGNGEAYDLIVGNDSKFVQVSSTGNIIMSSYDSANGISYPMTLDTTGNLVLPQLTTISDESGIGTTLTVGAPPTVIVISGADFSPVNTTYTKTSAATPTWEPAGYNPATDPYIEFSGGEYGIFNPGFVQALYVNTGTLNKPLTQWSVNPPLGSIAPTAVYTYGASGPDWLFGADGKLTFPGTPRIDTDANNFEVQAAEAINFEANTVVNIYTDAGNNAYQWQFGDDGNLTLPGNTFAVNYANGTAVSIGGGANTGNVTFDDNIVIGTGDEFGSAGLFLAPGNGSIANSAVQYLRVRGGDFPTHIHLDTGNNQYYDQYFGADSRYLKLEANGNVVINADDYAANSGTWTFTSDGNLILADGNSVIQSIANSSLDTLNPNVSTMVLTPDPGYGSQALVLDPTLPGHIHLRAPGANIDEPSANLFLGGEDTAFEITEGANNQAVIHSNGKAWTFGNDGNISSDTLTFTTTFANVKTVEYQTAGVWDLYVEDGITGSNTASSRLNVSFKDNLIDQPQVYIENTKESDGIALRWTFDENGNLNFPRDVAGNSDPYLNIFGGSTPTIQSTDVSLAGPANLAIQSDYLNLSGSTGNRIILQADAGAIATDAAMVLSTNLADPGNIVSWTLDTTGNLTLPDTTSVIANVSITLEANDTGNITGLSLIGDSNANLYAHGNVTIVSDSSNTTATWAFGADGNLTLPGNTFAVNYANGTQVSIGGGGNTGNVTFSDINIIGTGNLKLQPDSANASAYLDIFLTAGPDIHIAGNGETVILGTDDFANVAVNVDGNVSIQAGDANGTHTWTLDTTGNLTLPGNLIIAGNTSVFGTDAALIAPTDDKPLIALSSGANGAVSSLWVEDIGNVGTSNIAAVYANPTSGSKIVRIAVGQNGGNTGPNLWDFGTTGILTLPQGSQISETANTSVNITANANTWAFGVDGNLTVPGSIINDTSIVLSAPAVFNICTIATAGSGYNTGSSLKATTGGSGTGMTVGIGYGLSNQLTSVSVVNPGTGYVNGDVITVSEGTGGTFVITKYNVLANQTNNNTVQTDLIFANNTLTIPVDGNLVGNLIVPGSIVGSGASPAPYISGFSSVSALQFKNGNSNVTVNANSNLWTFDSTGNLTIPGTSGGFIKTASNASIGIAAVDNGTNNPAQLLSLNAGTGAATSIVSAYATNVAIQTNAAGAINTWSFDNAGNLTLPANAFAINYANGTQVSLGGGNVTWAQIDDKAGNSGPTIITLGQNAGFDGQGNAAIAIGKNAGAGGQGASSITIGEDAGGNITQGANSVAIGRSAGFDGQGIGAVAIGSGAGSNTQGNQSVAIGENAGVIQGSTAVAIGQNAGGGVALQGDDAVAIGHGAGSNAQGTQSVAIGLYAGQTTQGTKAVAIGDNAGNTSQGNSAVAIGENAGYTTQGISAVAVGDGAGRDTQGQYAVAVGYGAGNSNQANNSIILNATGSILDQTTANTFTVAPVRNDTSNIAEVMFYNATSKEVTYGNTINVAGNITGAYILGNGSGLTSLPAPTVTPDISSNGDMSIMTYDGVIRSVNYATVEPSSGNIKGGNISTTGIVAANTANITTGNITTINSGLLQNGNSNITITANGNVSIQSAGSNVELVVTSTGANVTGTFNATGNISGGNISATGNVSGTYLISTHASANEGGEISLAQPPNGNLSGGITIDAYQNTLRMFEQGGTARGLSVDIANSPAGGGTAIGYRDIPQVAAGNVTLGATDAGKHYYSTTAGNLTLTIPLNSSVPFTTGAAISIVVQAAGNILVNAAAGVTLYMAGNSTAANRVVGGYGMATLIKVATDTWFINGTGVS